MKLSHKYKTGDEIRIVQPGRDGGRYAVISYRISRGVYVVRFLNGLERTMTECEFTRWESEV